MASINDLVLGIISELVDRSVKISGVPLNLRINEGFFEVFPDSESDNFFADQYYKFEGGNFQLENVHSCDSLEVSSVYYCGRMVYRDDTYEGEPLKVRTYERGEWEEKLKELHNKISEEQLSFVLN